jgi:tRNA pseudouridine synthase 10
LDIKTSAGTYVKEFVNGDFGRTVPSVTSLLNCKVDLERLDVTEIIMDW